MTSVCRPFALLAGMVAAVYSFGSVAIALEAIQHWEAFSVSAEGITGNVDITGTRMVFENRTVLELSYVGSASGVVLSAPKDLPAKIYRITNPQNPILLHGNTLCSEIPFYVAWVEQSMKPLMEEWNELLLVIIKGREAPRANMDPNRICSAFTFTRVVGKH